MTPDQEYYLKNKEQIRKRRKEYYQQNREKEIARSLNYYYLHREERIRKISEWQKNNPERYKQIKLKKDLAYLFRKRFGGLRETIIQRDGEKCQICGITREEHKKKYGKDIAVDHIDGSGRNSSISNNSPENLRTLCLVCNLHRAFSLA